MGSSSFHPTILLQGGVTIGVIGLTNLIPAHIKDVKISDFIKTGEAQIAELKQQVDIIVVLANVTRNMNKAMNAAFADADYIFLSRNTVRTRPGTKQPVNGPFTYGSNIQGKYLAQVSETHIAAGSEAMGNLRRPGSAAFGEGGNHHIGGCQLRLQPLDGDVVEGPADVRGELLFVANGFRLCVVAHWTLPAPPTL